MVYVDVLLGVNLIVDYVLLMTVGKLLSLPLKRKRVLLGAGLGAAGSLVILLPPMPVGISVLISIAEACLMTAAAVCPVSGRVFAKAAALLFLVSFLYSGFMMAAMSLFAARYIAVRNGAVYVGMSPFLLIGLTLLCYGLLRLFYGLSGTRIRGSRCRVSVRYEGEIQELDGMIDTGNRLHEPFSGECVIVANEEKFGNMPGFRAILDRKENAEFHKGIRMVPFSSVGGSGLIPAFRPKEIRIIWDNKECKVSAWLALCSRNRLSEGCDVLVPYELIMKGS